MNWLIPLVERLSQILSLLASVGLSDRSAHLELLRQTLIGNSLFFGIWASWELDPSRTYELQGGSKRIATAFIRRHPDENGVEDLMEETALIPPLLPPSLGSRPHVTLRSQQLHGTCQLLAGISVPIAKDESGMSGTLGVDVVLAELAEEALLNRDRRTVELLATIERELQGALLVLTANYEVIGATPQALQKVEMLTGIACVRGEKLKQELLGCILPKAENSNQNLVRRDMVLPQGSFIAWTVPLSKKRRTLLFIQPPFAPAPQAASSSALSVREQQVLQCLAEGKSNSEIASVLCISPNTVKNHLDRVFKKMAVTNRYAAALAAVDRYPRA